MRSGVVSTRIGRGSTASRPSRRSRASSRSKRARSESESSGRGSPEAGRRPRTISTLVPGAISSSGIAAASMRAILPASPAPTPARCSMRAKLSPCARVATISRRGRSGADWSGITASVAAMCRPLSPPSASGMIIWLRNSSRADWSIRIGAAASTGAKSGQKSSATAARPNIVPAPRNHRTLPISCARSGARSRLEKCSESLSRHCP